MTRPKGMPKTRGRQKGSANKLTAGIKPMILGALSAKGGQRYFEEHADRNTAAFMAGRQADRESRPRIGSPPAAPVSFRHRDFRVAAKGQRFGHGILLRSPASQGINLLAVGRWRLLHPGLAGIAARPDFAAIGSA